MLDYYYMFLESSVLPKLLTTLPSATTLRVANFALERTKDTHECAIDAIVFLTTAISPLPAVSQQIIISVLSKFVLLLDAVGHKLLQLYFSFIFPSL